MKRSRQSSGAWRIVVTTALAGAITVSRPAHAVQLQPGDLVLVESRSSTVATRGDVFRLDPATLAPTRIGGGPLTASPNGVAVDLTGRILVADYYAGLVAVNPANGSQSVLVSPSALGGTAGGVLVGPSGDLFVSVFGGVNGIVRVSPNGATIQPLSIGGLLQRPMGLTLGPDGALYVAETAIPDNGLHPWGYPSHGSIVRVDPVSGAQTRIAADPLFISPFAILFAGADEIWTAQIGSVAGRGGCFVRTRISTGISTLVDTSPCRSHGMVKAADGGVVTSDCNTLGPDCYSVFTSRYPSGPVLNEYGGVMTLVPSGIVPTRRPSWGSLKTIYR